MRRLFHKIYLTIIVTLLMVVVVAGAIWRAGWESSPARQAFEMAAELASGGLPPADATQSQQLQALERLAQRVGTDLALFATNRELIAAVGEPLRPPPTRHRGGWFVGPGGPAWSWRLPDGRILVARVPMRARHPALSLVLFLGTIAVVIAACAYPVVRGLTHRLERLQAGVETLGAGDLSARVKVEGRDEVAALAASFNRAAARIEELVNAHRMLLSNASHELRTPLSRIRLGIELFKEKGDPKYKAELERDIGELDGLIDEILLASRLDAKLPFTPSPGELGRGPATGDGHGSAGEEVDLLALAAEECARYDCSAEGASVTVRGDPRLLRRLIRNLIENARRHGQPPIRVEVKPEGELAVLIVSDAGRGIPEAERERVFQPFHHLGTESAGAGLGLALVRQIARLHGGEAVVAPLPDAPSSLRVTLPRPAG
jgi:signal transduction histidine kinase